MTAAIRAEAVQSWEQVRAWRKQQRACLIVRRVEMSRDRRAACEAAITARLAPLLVPRDGLRTVGLYWPFKGEYDPRPLMRSLHAAGLRPLLPAVVERARPLEFREWRPGIRMERGVWDIPVPAGAAVLPDLVVAPLVGFDAGRYRLGYGGGYYDRTLAALPSKPFTIGVGFEVSCLETIHPQPHDIPMDLIITDQRDAAVAGEGARHSDSRPAGSRPAAGIAERAP